MFKIALSFPINKFPEKKSLKKLAYVYYNEGFL